VLSRTNLAERTSLTSSISFISFRLRTLKLSCRSFSHPDPLFSITSALFLQNTRGGIPLRDLVRCTEAQKCLSVTPLLATLTHSVSRKSFPCHSYANTWDGGGFRLPSNLEHPTSNLCICPSYAPRGASIPCAVTRLRILPVATGVYPFALPIPLRLWQSQLTRPLFSYSYELLFPQPLLFHIHTNPPGVWGDRSSRFNASLLGSYSAGVFLRN